MNSFEFKKYKEEVTLDIKLILEKIDSISKTNNSYVAKAKTYFDDKIFITPPISADTEVELKFALADVIYHQYYKRRQDEGNFEKENFANELEKNIKHSKRFFGGWQIDTPYASEDGRIIVGKNLYSRKEIFNGNFLTQELTFPIAKNNRVLVRGRQDIKNEENLTMTPNDDTEKIPYYYFFSKFIPDDDRIDETFVRFYFNLNPEINKFKNELANFINFLREQLNLRYIPFIFKVLNNLKKFTNADNFVLYIEKRYFCAVIDLIQIQISCNFKNLLRVERPMFTYRLADGIGFSEQPIQNRFSLKTLSFGSDRSLLIADAIIRNLKNDDWKKVDKIISTIEVDNQISIVEIFLNSSKSKNYYPNIQPNSTNNQKRIDKIAILAGNKLCSEAIWDKRNRCTWITINEVYKYNTLDNSLTNGLAGVVYFLEKLINATNEPVFERYFEGAMKCLKIKLYDKNYYRKGIIKHGFHLGELMSFYIVKKYGKDYIKNGKHPELFEADEILDSLNRACINSYNVERGLAGTIISLLYLFELDKDIKYLNKAVEFGKQLLGKCSDNNRYNHPEPFNIGLPLGASGIGITFFLLKIVLQKINCQDAAFLTQLGATGAKAIDFENEFKEDTIWKNDKNGSTFNLYWNMGLIGVFLSRKLLTEIEPTNKTWKTDFDDAFESFKKFMMYDVYIELKRSAIFYPDLAECYLNKPENIKQHIKGSLYENLKNDNLKIENTLANRTGVDKENPLIGFSPTLQNGFAGLGYTALRLLDPNLPSILVPSTEFSL